MHIPTTTLQVPVLVHRFPFRGPNLHNLRILLQYPTQRLRLPLIKPAIQLLHIHPIAIREKTLPVIRRKWLASIILHIENVCPEASQIDLHPRLVLHRNFNRAGELKPRHAMELVLWPQSLSIPRAISIRVVVGIAAVGVQISMNHLVQESRQHVSLVIRHGSMLFPIRRIHQEIDHEPSAINTLVAGVRAFAETV